MKALAADSFRVSREARGLSDAAEDVVLAFGRERSSDSSAESTVELLEELVLSPATATRLLERLQEALRHCRPPPARAGARRAPLDAVLAQTAAMRSSQAPWEAGREGAAKLFSWMDGLGVPYRHERSFRMKAGSLHANRFLLSVDLPRIRHDAAAVLSNCAEALEMPAPFAAEARACAPRACSLHLGFEGDEQRLFYKLYLEFPPAEREAFGDARLLHRAFKWDAAPRGEGPARQVETHYLLFPETGVEAMEERIASLYGPGAEASLEVVREILALAFSRGRPSQYLEVLEPGSPRRSFDLNLYDLGLAMKELQPWLARLRRRYEIAPSRFQAFYDQIQPRTLGHVAGGVHREGEDFFTFYFGAEVLGRT